jgi:transcriptional regulator with XRE-family HTH domain
MRVRLQNRWKETLASRLRDARVAAGMTQAQLAEAIGVNHRTIAGVERGRRSAGFEVILLWVTACKTEPAALFEGLQ